jgi:hypothetical protein
MGTSSFESFVQLTKEMTANAKSVFFMIGILGLICFYSNESGAKIDIKNI